MKNEDGDALIICLYVDDLIFIGSNPSMFEEFKQAMTKEFKVTDIGLMSYYLGIKVKQEAGGTFFSQEGYARKVLKKFKMDNGMPINTPVECGTKLSKYDKGERIDPNTFQEFGWKLMLLDMHKV